MKTKQKPIDAGKEKQQQQWIQKKNEDTHSNWLANSVVDTCNTTDNRAKFHAA